MMGGGHFVVDLFETVIICSYYLSLFFDIISALICAVIHLKFPEFMGLAAGSLFLMAANYCICVNDLECFELVVFLRWY